MYKSKLGKTQLRIGLSRNDKPQSKSPIKITTAPGVRPRTLGLSRNYKPPKNIDNLVKSPILTNPLSVCALNANTQKQETITVKMLKNTESQKIFEKKFNIETKTIVNSKSDLKEASSEVRSTGGKNRLFSPCNRRRSHQSVDEIEENGTKDVKVHDCVNIPEKALENGDASISYSPLDNFDSTPSEERPQNKNLLKAKRLILGNLRNTPKSVIKSPEKNVSITSNSSNVSSTKSRKISRLSLKKSCTIAITDDESEEEIKSFKKRTFSNTYSNTSLTSNISDCSVILERIPQDSLEAYGAIEFEQNEAKAVEHYKKNESFNLNQTDHIDKGQLVDSIMVLDKVLRTKSAELDTLKQSVIYKKKHNVEDLTAVVKIWKDGCKLALNDLLIKLREVVQSDMSMDALLKQLNVPDYIFKYDIESEELI